MRNAEQHEILGAFLDMLSVPTGDGGVKRAAGSKPFWKVDPGHEAAFDRHYTKWCLGERYDPDSGAHHLTHLAWRALAIAYQEMVEDGLIPESPPQPAPEPCAAVSIEPCPCHLCRLRNGQVVDG